jgi:hypothetical protein
MSFTPTDRYTLTTGETLLKEGKNGEKKKGG